MFLWWHGLPFSLEPSHPRFSARASGPLFAGAGSQRARLANFLKRLRNHDMKLRDCGWVLEVAFLRLARSLLLCWGRGRVIANDSKLSRNYGFGNISGHGPIKKEKQLPAAMAAIEIAELWGADIITMIPLFESRKTEIDAKFPPQEPPTKRGAGSSGASPQKGATSMMAIARENHQMLASRSTSAIQEIHQSGVETRLAMKHGGLPVWGHLFISCCRMTAIATTIGGVIVVCSFACIISLICLTFRMFIA